MLRASCVTYCAFEYCLSESQLERKQRPAPILDLALHHAGLGKILNAWVCIQAQKVGVFLKWDCLGVWKSCHDNYLRLNFLCRKTTIMNAKPTLTKLTEGRFCQFLLLDDTMNICAHALLAFMVSLTFSIWPYMFNSWVTWWFYAVYFEDLPKYFLKKLYYFGSQDSCMILSIFPQCCQFPWNCWYLISLIYFLCVYSKSLVVLTSFYMFVDSLYIVFGNILVHF